jgi:hypothetical protein
MDNLRDATWCVHNNILLHYRYVPTYITRIAVVAAVLDRIVAHGGWTALTRGGNMKFNSAIQLYIYIYI